MLESEPRGAMVFVDGFKARLQERCGNNKGQAETDRTPGERAGIPRAIARLVVALAVYSGAL